MDFHGKAHMGKRSFALCVDTDHIESQARENFRKIAQQSGAILRMDNQVDGVYRRGGRCAPGHIDDAFWLTRGQRRIARASFAAAT